MSKKKKKTERESLLAKVPSNYHFWRLVVLNADQLLDFLARGDTKQLGSIKRTLKYMKKVENETFKSIGGNEWLKKLKD